MESNEPTEQPSNPGFQPSDFIKAYCSGDNGLIRDPLVADAVWISFCKQMLRFLLIEKKPVDIFFARLIAFQARRNWAQVLALHDKENNKRRPHETEIRSIVERKIHEGAIDPKMLAMTKDGIFDWTIEVMTNKRWRTLVEKIENDRKHQSEGKLNPQTGARYLESAIRQLKKQVPDMIMAYAQFLAKARLPGVRILAGDRFIRWRKVKAGKRFRFFNPWVGSIPAFTEFEDSSDPTLAETDEALPEVPNLQPVKANMRNTDDQKWIDLDQCLSGSTG